LKTIGAKSTSVPKNNQIFGIQEFIERIRFFLQFAFTNLVETLEHNSDSIILKYLGSLFRSHLRCFTEKIFQNASF